MMNNRNRLASTLSRPPSKLAKIVDFIDTSVSSW